MLFSHCYSALTPRLRPPSARPTRPAAGKGSTAAIVASALSAAGLRTGLYTSPHLEHLRERIRVEDPQAPAPPRGPLSGPPPPPPGVVPPDAWERLCASARPAVDAAQQREGGALTHFEVITALALRLFAEGKADAAVVEARGHARVRRQGPTAAGGAAQGRAEAEGARGPPVSASYPPRPPARSVVSADWARRREGRDERLRRGAAGGGGRDHPGQGAQAPAGHAVANVVCCPADGCRRVRGAQTAQEHMDALGGSLTSVAQAKARPPDTKIGRAHV